MANDLQSVAVKFVQEPTKRHRTDVVLAAVPLVRSIVGRLSIPDHPLATREDLESVGQLGLLQALDGFDPERGTPFVSYAYGRVRGALVDYLRSIDALPRERRRVLAEAHHAMDKLRQKLGDEPSDHEVAEYLNMTLIDYHTLLRDARVVLPCPCMRPSTARVSRRSSISSRIRILPGPSKRSTASLLKTISKHSLTSFQKESRQ